MVTDFFRSNDESNATYLQYIPVGLEQFPIFSIYLDYFSQNTPNLLICFRLDNQLKHVETTNQYHTPLEKHHSSQVAVSLTQRPTALRTVCGAPGAARGSCCDLVAKARVVED